MPIPRLTFDGPVLVREVLLNVAWSFHSLRPTGLREHVCLRIGVGSRFKARDDQVSMLQVPFQVGNPVTVAVARSYCMGRGMSNYVLDALPCLAIARMRQIRPYL